MKLEVLFSTVSDALEDFTKETGIKASAKRYSDSVGVFIGGEGRAFNVLEVHGSFVMDYSLNLSTNARKAWKIIIGHVINELHKLIDQYFQEHKDETFYCGLNEEERDLSQLYGDFPPPGMEKGCPFCKDRYDCRCVRERV